MKYEWRKKEKELYLPKTKPSRISVPEFRFFTIEGEGNPNDAFFKDYVGVLYALSYAIKMSPKKGLEPAGYWDYTVYPLEGVWDIREEAKKEVQAALNKDDLVFKLMIRQPDFVEESYAQQTIERVKNSKPHQLLDQVKFEKLRDGDCIQMMHVGSYDSEPESFRVMEDFAAREKLTRLSKVHREIYLSDVQKVAPEKLKTVLRFAVSSQKE